MDTPTKVDALCYFLSKAVINAEAVGYDYDPAGSTMTYVPELRELELLSALVQRPAAAGELWLEVGVVYDRFKLTNVLLAEIRASLRNLLEGA